MRATNSASSFKDTPIRTKNPESTMWGYDDDDAANYDYETNGYSGYDSDRIDPSPWALIGTIGICVSLILVLPLFVAMRQACRKRRKKRRGKKDTATVSTACSDDSKKKSLLAHPETATTDADIAELYGLPEPGEQSDKTKALNLACTPAFCAADSAFFIMEDMAFDNDDDVSVYGLSKEQKHKHCNAVAAAVTSEPSPELDIDRFPKRLHWGGTRSRSLARLFLRPFGGDQNHPTEPKNVDPVTVVKTDTEKQAANTFRLVGFGDDDRVEVVHSAMNEASDSDSLGGDLGSVDDRDFLTRLADEIHFGDIDDDDESVNSSPDDSVLPKEDGDAESANVYINMDGIFPEKEENDEDKNKISLCCGSRPWFGYYFSGGFLRKVCKCASWDDEMKRIVKLAIPYSTHALVTGVLELMEVAVIGQVFAKDNSSILGAYFAVGLVSSLATMLLDGATSSLTVLCSHAVGGRNFALAGKYCQLAFLFYQLIFIPIIAICWNRIDNIVIRFGYEEYIAVEAQNYGRLSFITTSAGVLNTCVHNMLDVCGFAWYSSVMDILHGLASLVAVFFVGETVPDVKLWMIGAVHLSLAIFFMSVNILIVTQKEWLTGFWQGFFSCSVGGSKAIRVFSKTAMPLSVGYVISCCEWEILFIFAASQGPAEVVVWGLMGYIWSFGEELGAAVANASEVRVAKLIGSHMPALARYSSHKSLLLGVVQSSLMSLLILAFNIHIPMWLTKDEAIQQMLSDLLPLVCVGLAALTLGSTSWTIICAQGRTRLATTVSLLGSVFVTLPLAIVSTFALDWNLQGLLASTVIGYALSGIINSFFMVSSNWERISRKVARRNAKAGAGMDGPDSIMKGGNPDTDDYTAFVDDSSHSTKSGKSTKSNPTSGKASEMNAAEFAATPDDASESPKYDNFDWCDLPKEGTVIVV